MDIVNTSPEGREAQSEQSNATAVDDCTIDDIDRLKTCAESFDDGNNEDEIEGGDAKKETIYYSCFGIYEDNRYDSCEGCDLYFKCKKVTEEKGIERQTGYPEQYETIDDLEGLAEPEPIWTPFIENEQHEKQELDLIAEKWFHIEHSLRMVRKMHLDKAEQDFKDRLELFLV